MVLIIRRCAKLCSDFEAYEKKINFEDNEKSICNDIEQKLNNFNGKKICIALSGVSILHLYYR